MSRVSRIVAQLSNCHDTDYGREFTSELRNGDEDSIFGFDNICEMGLAEEVPCSFSTEKIFIGLFIHKRLCLKHNVPRSVESFWSDWLFEPN
jgi:hypothetical protein